MDDGWMWAKAAATEMNMEEMPPMVEVVGGEI
jgi:hypothetical protein